jgi:(p)ppGpp synthase/HD superfamily hydrolase
MQPKYLKDEDKKKKMLKENIPSTFLTKRYLAAMEYAISQHKDQTRKQTNIPYISHCLAVSSLVLEAGGDEDQAIAGLLHDVAEDCGGEPRLVEIENLFGKRVAKIVRGCSDSLTESETTKAPWKERKLEHLNKLRQSDKDILIVTGADKTHNARAIVTDSQIIGDRIWNRFNAEKSDITWYYKSVLEILVEKKVPKFLTSQLDSLFNLMIAEKQ